MSFTKSIAGKHSPIITPFPMAPSTGCYGLILLTLVCVLSNTSVKTASSQEPRPPKGDAEIRARLLFEAIVHDDPTKALGFFFPREPFLEIKGIRDPGSYYDKLLAHYERDIHELHRAHPDLARAKFLSFELAKRGGWVPRGEEANRLPYWASRHSHLFYTVDNTIKTIEVRVLIAWNGRWYITHLSEFKRRK